MWGTSCAKHLDENNDNKEIIEEDVRFLFISCNKCEIIRGDEYIAHELAKKSVQDFTGQNPYEWITLLKN